jgi:hypothetical protein
LLDHIVGQVEQPFVIWDVGFLEGLEKDDDAADWIVSSILHDVTDNRQAG